MVSFGSILGVMYSVPTRGSQASAQGNKLIASCKEVQQYTFSLADNEMYLVNITDKFVKYFFINLMSLSNKYTLVQGPGGRNACIYIHTHTHTHTHAYIHFPSLSLSFSIF
jgi:hypothetical protein